MMTSLVVRRGGGVMMIIIMMIMMLGDGASASVELGPVSEDNQAHCGVCHLVRCVELTYVANVFGGMWGGGRKEVSVRLIHS